MTQATEEQVKSIEEKNTEQGYSAVLRVISVADDSDDCNRLHRSITGTFSQYG